MMKKDKIRGTLIGGAIGDALGYQIEFSTNIKEKQITKYFDDEGIISDDTQMTLFTANALLWRETRGNLKGISPTPSSAIYMGYLDWLQTQTKKESDLKICWIKDIHDLNVPRAPGNTCLSSLLSGKFGTLEEPMNNSKGCGSVMRVAPIGLYAKDAETAGIVAAEASALTHGHPLGIISSYVCAAMINILLNSNKTISEALEEARKLYYDKFNKYSDEIHQEFDSLIDRAIGLSKKKISDIEAIKQLGEGWVADEAFAIALYSCLKYSNNFKDAVVCAINHDGDSDSTGAIAGNIIGTYLGYSKIPLYYIENIELKDIILEIADDLSIPVPVSEYSTNNDEYWLSKYLYCERDLGKKKKGF